jgi:hypothetical protein
MSKTVSAALASAYRWRGDDARHLCKVMRCDGVMGTGPELLGEAAERRGPGLWPARVALGLPSGLALVARLALGAGSNVIRPSSATSLLNAAARREIVPGLGHARGDQCRFGSLAARHHGKGSEGRSPSGEARCRADRGYFNSEEILACEQAGITVTLPKPMTSGAKAEGRFGKQDFVYKPEEDVDLCPAGETLKYYYTNVENGLTLRRYLDNRLPELSDQIPLAEDKQHDLHC